MRSQKDDYGFHKDFLYFGREHAFTNSGILAWKHIYHFF